MENAIALKFKTKYLNFNVSPKLLNADAWHKRSSGNISRNGIRLPLTGSIQVLCLALCCGSFNDEKNEKNKKKEMLKMIFDVYQFLWENYFKHKQINVHLLVDRYLDYCFSCAVHVDRFCFQCWENSPSSSRQLRKRFYYFYSAHK